MEAFLNTLMVVLFCALLSPFVKFGVQCIGFWLESRNESNEIKTITPTLSGKVIVIEDDAFKTELQQSADRLRQIINKHKEAKK